MQKEKKEFDTKNISIMQTQMLIHEILNRLILSVVHLILEPRLQIKIDCRWHFVTPWGMA